MEASDEPTEPGTPPGPPPGPPGPPGPPRPPDETIPHTFTLPFNMLQGIMMDMLQGQGPTIGPLEDNITTRSFHEQPRFKQVTTKDFINSLSVQKVSEELVEKKTTCGVCLDELTLGEDIVELPCQDKHYFHIKKEECGGIYPWLKENNTCPLCRHEFPSEEKKVEQEEIGPERMDPPPPTLVMPTPNMIRNMVHQVVDEEEERMMQEALYSSLSK